MGSPSVPAPQPLPWLFFIVAIAVAVVVAAFIAYLGVTGHLGAGVTGSKSPGSGITSWPLVGLILSVSTSGMGWRPA